MDFIKNLVTYGIFFQYLSAFYWPSELFSMFFWVWEKMYGFHKNLVTFDVYFCTWETWWFCVPTKRFRNKLNMFCYQVLSEIYQNFIEPVIYFLCSFWVWGKVCGLNLVICARKIGDLFVPPGLHLEMFAIKLQPIRIWFGHNTNRLNDVNVMLRICRIAVLSNSLRYVW